MRIKSNQLDLDDALVYFLTDHLGGTTVTLNASGIKTAELRYMAWGETRYSDGETPTQRKYTGQLEAEAGLYFFNARWMDPSIGRFLQPDSIIPDPYNPVTLDRYAYVNNNPVNRVDPSGHADAVPISAGCSDENCRTQANEIAVFVFGFRHNNNLLQPANPKPTIGANQTIPTTIGPNPSVSVASSPQLEPCKLNLTVSLTDEDVANGLDLLGNGLDVGEAAFGKTIPVLSLASSVYAQAFNDYGKGFTSNQSMVREAVVGAENIGTGIITSSFVAGAVMVISGPPGWIVGGTVSVVVIIYTTNVYKSANEKIIFPLIQRNIK